MKNAIFALPIIFLLVGCATDQMSQMNSAQIPGLGAKVIALDAPRKPWAIEIKNHLKAKGFKVLQWSTGNHVIEQTEDSSVVLFNEFEARYVLVIEGFAPYDWAKRWAGKCIEGCYNFVRLSAGLVNITTDETMLKVSSSGYSEKCHPISGTIFSDIANAVNDAWD